MNDTIRIQGARENNLKSVDLTIPRDKLVVFTGLSGAGQAREYHQFISGDGQVDVLQIVLSGSLDADLVIHICTLLQS